MEYWILDTGYWIQDPGYRLQDPGYRLQDPGYRLLDTGWALAIPMPLLYQWLGTTPPPHTPGTPPTDSRTARLLETCCSALLNA